jgi:hypothetical protein
LPVEQAHDTFDQDQVGRFRCPGQAPARIVFATHAEIEVLAGTAAGEGVNLRVEKIRAAFENVTRRPWRLCSRASAAVTVVFLAGGGAAISSAGQDGIRTRVPAWP